MGRNSIFGNVIYCAVLLTDKNLLQNRPEQFKIRTFYLAQIDTYSRYNLKRSTNEILKWFSIQTLKVVISSLILKVR